MTRGDLDDEADELENAPSGMSSLCRIHPIHSKQRFCTAGRVLNIARRLHLWLLLYLVNGN